MAHTSVNWQLSFICSGFISKYVVFTAVATMHKPIFAQWVAVISAKRTSASSACLVLVTATYTGSQSVPKLLLGRYVRCRICLYLGQPEPESSPNWSCTFRNGQYSQQCPIELSFTHRAGAIDSSGEAMVLWNNTSLASFLVKLWVFQLTSHIQYCVQPLCIPLLSLPPKHFAVQICGCLMKEILKHSIKSVVSLISTSFISRQVLEACRLSCVLVCVFFPLNSWVLMKTCKQAKHQQKTTQWMLKTLIIHSISFLNDVQ